jgi:cyclophilin family peptidyl-prolyl cis-trans isomerase
MVHTDESCAYLDGKYTVFGQIVEGLDVNLSLSINYTREGALKLNPSDYIIKAWVEFPEYMSL